MIPSHLGDKRLFRQKYILINSNNEIAGFRIRVAEDLSYEYLKYTYPALGLDDSPTGGPTTEYHEFPITEELYEVAIKAINEHKICVIDDLTTITPAMYPLNSLGFVHKDVTVDEYKTFKCAELVYYYRQKIYKPFEYNGNYFDSYYLRNNFYDMRLIQELSLDKTVDDTIKLTTINNNQVVMSSENFLKFYKEFTAYINEVLNQQSIELDNIKNATTKEDIDTIINNAKNDVVHYPEDSIFLPIYERANTYMSFTEAPNDGKAYVRQNGKWTEAHDNLISPIAVSSDTNVSNKVDEAPNDNDCYARRQTSWHKIVTNWRVKV